VKDQERIVESLGAWQLAGAIRIEPLSGGINSHTWRVSCDAGQFVAKLVAHDDIFADRLAIAERLERLGFRAGAPIRTRGGSLTTSVGDRTLALLRFERGEPIDTARAADLRVWGAAMARFHALLHDRPSIPDTLQRWPWTWIDPAAEYLRVGAWVRPAIERALAEVRQLEAARMLTIGVVHGDGAQPLLDRATGEPAVIDWGAAMWGPLLYDVGSALWLFRFKDGRDPHDFAPFLEAYRSLAPLPGDELEALPVFVRLRCVVQALYFSWRIADDVRTGLADPAENQIGLDNARIAWEALG
jgi:homoserine kinase type II